MRSPGVGKGEGCWEPMGLSRPPAGIEAKGVVSTNPVSHARPLADTCFVSLSPNANHWMCCGQVALGGTVQAKMASMKVVVEKGRQGRMAQCLDE